MQKTANSQSNTEWYWHKNRHEKRTWIRIKDPDMSPYNYTHLIFDKVAKNVQWRKDSLFQQMLLWKVVVFLQETETTSLSITLY
jgi:hypothetical protein